MKKPHKNHSPVLTRLRDAVYGSALYGPARDIYQILLDREGFRNRGRMKGFYGQFFQRGELVFDIGANVGNYSETFSTLGATVVAVEPNPFCCQSLCRLARARDIRVERCAVGASAGTASLRVCDQNVLCTLSDEWFQQIENSSIHRGAHWVEQIEVPVVTLDSLAERYGVPAFVKIDVEGYEENVIDGMSFDPKFLSFEFNDLLREVAIHCVEKLGRRGYEFNPIAGLEFEFQFPNWKTGQQTLEWLASYKGKEEFGDIFARHL